MEISDQAFNVIGSKNIVFGCVAINFEIFTILTKVERRASVVWLCIVNQRYWLS